MEDYTMAITHQRENVDRLITLAADLRVYGMDWAVDQAIILNRITKR